MALVKTYLHGKTCYSFTNRFFTYQGKKFEIVGTESTGRGAHDAIHLVKSESGQYKNVTMTNLLKKLLKENDLDAV